MDFMTLEVREIALNLMEALDSPRSLTVSLLVRAKEWTQLVNLECVPRHYLTADAYYRAVVATDFLRKKDGRIAGLDPKGATDQKWLDCEQQCFKTNQRIYEYLHFGTLSGSPAGDVIDDFFCRARKNIVKLIGPRPPLNVDGKFGPGATMSDPGDRTTVAHKMSSTPSITSAALGYLIPWTGTKWANAVAYRGDDISFVNGNSYFTVPKSAKILRPCAKEPAINGFYQLGYGSVMKRRLHAAGIDLIHGKAHHMQVARDASLKDDMATIDLSSASDTLAEAVVKALLPPAWFHALNDLRSKKTYFKGRWHRLEKFSSMGNGFTFELESAIFASICWAAAPHLVPGHNLLVFGDDIIVPVDDAANVVSALKFFGFTLNVQKTFVSGDFRESCGGDYFLGSPVRAYYLENNPNEPQHFISIANGIRRVMANFSKNSAVHARLRLCWFRVLDNIPSTIRSCRGPEELGDLVVCDDEQFWSTRLRNSIRWVRVYRPCEFARIHFARFDPSIQVAVALYGVRLAPQLWPKKIYPVGYDPRGLSLRDGVLGYKVGWVPFS